MREAEARAAAAAGRAWMVVLTRAVNELPTTTATARLTTSPRRMKSRKPLAWGAARRPKVVSCVSECLRRQHRHASEAHGGTHVHTRGGAGGRGAQSSNDTLIVSNIAWAHLHAPAQQPKPFLAAPSRGSLSSAISLVSREVGTYM